ncbi:ROK family transcriptional regulator [Streptomyces sp. H27-D2]|uniref:ROK family transcriptional regulator n=1 Tax=Streptomyces sp. H27-D2 TaxID=3046304 RepID=UPI002DB7FC2F|nr:ROK family transcriptional regulator [Streptomyces sp. H27-D2]MEC4014897.1 ROK family transcriptional regulator [Streptomyces sp. H27-D2]
MNDRAALDLLLEHGPLSRTRIGELTGLSKPTASQLLGRLETAGLVRTTGTVSGGPGPNAQLYEVDPSTGYVAALDVDPDGITAVVADITGRHVGEHHVVADAEGRTATLVTEAVDGALAAAGLRRADLRRTVIGTPGALDPHTGKLRYAPHLPGWHSRTLRDDLAGALGTPVVIENDVNLAAIAEQRRGAAQGCEDFVLLWADEGVGAAIVLGGNLLRGATGGAGEVGYMPMPGAPLARGGPESTCGPDGGGGFQRLVSAPGVLGLAHIHGFHPKTVAEALELALSTPGEGDAVLDELAHRLATGLAAVIAVVDPELVVLSGSVPQAGGERLRALVEAELTGLALPLPRLRMSAVEGSPILIGALQSALADARDAVFDTS